jgi:hypothetical protein
MAAAAEFASGLAALAPDQHLFPYPSARNLSNVYPEIGKLAIYGWAPSKAFSKPTNISRKGYHSVALIACAASKQADL